MRNTQDDAIYTAHEDNFVETICTDVDLMMFVKKNYHTSSYEEFCGDEFNCERSCLEIFERVWEMDPEIAIGDTKEAIEYDIESSQNEETD